MKLRFLIAAMVLVLMPVPSIAQTDHLHSAFEGLDASAKRAVQEQLQAGGFYSGAVDGSYGPGTDAALRNGAEFIYSGTQPRIAFDLSSEEGARRYIRALAHGELAEHLLGEGEASGAD